MTPPDESSHSVTLAHAAEALRRSERPLTAEEILGLIPPPSRVSGAEMERLLTGVPQVEKWPARAPSRKLRYWSRTPADVVETETLELLTSAAMSPSALEKKLARALAGLSGTARRALLKDALRALVGAKKLYVHPVGRFKKYSSRPAQASAYVRSLRKQLDALAAKLTAAGVTRGQILEALAVEAPAAETQALADRILRALRSKPGGTGVAQLRTELALAGEERKRFDDTVLELYRGQRVYLAPHDFPAGLDEATRKELVTDGAGNYFVVIGLRDDHAESVP